jgi:hypothetical protein
MSKHPQLPILLEFLVAVSYRLQNLETPRYLPLLDLPVSFGYIQNMVKSSSEVVSKDGLMGRFTEYFSLHFKDSLSVIRDLDYLFWFQWSEDESLRLKSIRKVRRVASAIYRRHTDCVDRAVDAILQNPATGII